MNVDSFLTFPSLHITLVVWNDNNSYTKLNKEYIFFSLFFFSQLCLRSKLILLNFFCRMAFNSRRKADVLTGNDQFSISTNYCTKYAEKRPLPSKLLLTEMIEILILYLLRNIFIHKTECRSSIDRSCVLTLLNVHDPLSSLLHSTF